VKAKVNLKKLKHNVLRAGWIEEYSIKARKK